MQDKFVEQETRMLVRAWIWLWYNDTFRLLVVMLGGHLAVTLPLMQFIGVNGEDLRTSALVLYIGGLAWAMLDNNYANLNRIGLDVYRKPLPKKDFSLHKPQTPVSTV